MPKQLGIGAVVVGGVGVLLCATIVGIGWRAAARTAACLERVAAQLDHGFVRVRNAAEKIDRAADPLNGLRARVEALKSAKAVRLARELGTLAREAITGKQNFRVLLHVAWCVVPRVVSQDECRSLDKHFFPGVRKH